MSELFEANPQELQKIIDEFAQEWTMQKAERFPNPTKMEEIMNRAVRALESCKELHKKNYSLKEQLNNTFANCIQINKKYIELKRHLIELGSN